MDERSSSTAWRPLGEHRGELRRHTDGRRRHGDRLGPQSLDVRLLDDAVEVGLENRPVLVPHGCHQVAHWDPVALDSSATTAPRLAKERLTPTMYGPDCRFI